MSDSEHRNMHCNNKGILQTFFSPARGEQTTDTTPVHAPLLRYCFLSIHTPSICSSFPRHLSITVHVTTFDFYAAIRHSFNLFHSISLLHSLFSCLALICSLDTTLLPACLRRDRVLCFIFNVTMMQLPTEAFPHTELAHWVCACAGLEA